MFSKFSFFNNGLSGYCKKNSYDNNRYKPITNWQNLCDISRIGFLSCCDNPRIPENLLFLVRLFDNIPASRCTFQNLWNMMDTLPIYDCELHSLDNVDDATLKYIYSKLMMLINRLVWGDGVVNARNHCILPNFLGRILYEVCDSLEIVPALTHAAVDLWNFRLKDPSLGFVPENIEILCTMTDDPSEKWFYAVMIAIEGAGGRMLMKIMDLYCAILNKNYERIYESYVTLASVLDECVAIIRKMYDHCDPDFFFNRLRIFLSGSNNSNLPNGISFNGINMPPLKFIGGSAAQSSLIQIFDVLLCVVHKEKTKQFLDEMQFYMPGKHKKFLVALQRDYSYYFSKYLRKLNKNDPLHELVDDCRDKLVSFRNHHMCIVKRYIMAFVERQSPHMNNNAHSNRGTGGTNPVEFCGAVIMNTRNASHMTSDYKCYMALCALITVTCGWYIWRD